MGLLILLFSQWPCCCSMNLPSKFSLQSLRIFSSLPGQLLHFLRSLLRCHFPRCAIQLPHALKVGPVIVCPLVHAACSTYFYLPDTRMSAPWYFVHFANYLSPFTCLGGGASLSFDKIWEVLSFNLAVTYKSSLGLGYFCKWFISALLRWFSLSAIFQGMAVRLWFVFAHVSWLWVFPTCGSPSLSNLSFSPTMVWNNEEALT